MALTGSDLINCDCDMSCFLALYILGVTIRAEDVTTLILLILAYFVMGSDAQRKSSTLPLLSIDSRKWMRSPEPTVAASTPRLTSPIRQSGYSLLDLGLPFDFETATLGDNLHIYSLRFICCWVVFSPLVSTLYPLVEDESRHRSFFVYSLSFDCTLASPHDLWSFISCGYQRLHLCI